MSSNQGQSKQGQLSRSDLLSLIANQAEEATDPALIVYLADALGMQQQEAEIRKVTGHSVEDHWPDEQVTFKRDSPTDTPKHLQLSNPSPTAKLKAQYWQLLKQTNREDEDTDEQKKFTVRPVWQGRPQDRPRFPALMSEQVIQQRLLPMLRQEKATRRVDIGKLIEQVSRAEFVTELPMQHRSRDTQALHIIDDRQVHLMPYWLDHSWLTWHVRDSMADYRFSHAVIEQGDIAPQSILHNKLEDYQAPPEGSTILLLSDLGVLTGHFHRYTDFLDQLLTKGYHLVVVTPCHIHDYPAGLAANLHFVSWEPEGCELPKSVPASEVAPEQCPREQWAETLLMLCSTAIRLEPELLRTQRYALNDYLRTIGECPLPASAESLAWQHRAVVQKHSVAATVDAGENKHWQTRLKKQPIKLKQAVFERQRQWRGGKKGLPDEIWFEEFAAIDHCCDPTETHGLAWFNQDLEDTKHFLDYLNQRVLPGRQATEAEVLQTKAWLHRCDHRLTNEALSDGRLQKQLQTCLVSICDETGRTPAGHVIDPALRVKTHAKQPRQSAWLCQLGNQLAVTKHDPFTIPKNRSSLIARLDYRVCSLKLGHSSTPIKLPEHLGDALTPLLGSENIGVHTARLQTDFTELELAAFERPKWAKRVGRDAYGLFAELEIPRIHFQKEVPKTTLIQRFRWIPAGTFMMGSPASEPGRYEDEDRHQVTLTQGYWLADTTVTQEVWQAVMGDNPAHFKETIQNPVEQVSWDDSQDFIGKLNQSVSNQLGGLTLRLPTEAEWEYACRSGTKTPFSFGESVTSEQVNFNGSEPYNKGMQSEYREKTIAVKSLAPNQWGLYEMHGNVWEWCADAWQESLGTQTVYSPYHSDDSGAHRVLRGGSWFAYGRNVRSAFRNHYSPDFRSHDFGLRLSLGHELKARSAK